MKAHCIEIEKATTNEFRISWSKPQIFIMKSLSFRQEIIHFMQEMYKLFCAELKNHFKNQNYFNLED